MLPAPKNVLSCPLPGTTCLSPAATRKGELVLPSLTIDCTCVLSCFSHFQLFATLWTVAHKAPLSMEFSRQEYWSGLPFPFPGDLPDPVIEPTSPATPASAGTFFIFQAAWDYQDSSQEILTR